MPEALARQNGRMPSHRHNLDYYNIYDLDSCLDSFHAPVGSDMNAQLYASVPLVQLHEYLLACLCRTLGPWWLKLQLHRGIQYPLLLSVPPH